MWNKMQSGEDFYCLIALLDQCNAVCRNDSLDAGLRSGVQCRPSMQARHPNQAPEETGTPQRSRIVESVRQAIIDGTYPAGGQLPNQAALAETFGVSGFTVQRALNQLAQEGFIVQRPRIGTRVVDLPPHLRDLRPSLSPRRRGRP